MISHMKGGPAGLAEGLQQRKRLRPRALELPDSSAGALASLATGHVCTLVGPRRMMFELFLPRSPNHAPDYLRRRAITPIPPVTSNTNVTGSGMT
jgi:hypothetical protein